jgi:hypothetical protein
VYCDGDLDKFLETTKGIKDTANNTNSNISGNNVNLNVSNPDLHVHNPNINIPSSMGSVIGQAAGTLGLSATAVASIKGMGHLGRKMPPAARAAWLGGAGLIGASIFAVGNLTNTYLQNNYTNVAHKPINNDKNGPFPAKSIIEDGDNVDSIMNFLYFNLAVSVCILLLIVILIFFNYYKKNILFYMT